MQDAQATLPMGTLIRERYVVKGLLGQGSSSTVYLVEDFREKRTEPLLFALKEIRGLNRQERYQCIFESVLLRKIHHPALPRISHVFNDDKRGQVYLVMDYVEGLDLETTRQKQLKQRFAETEVVQLLSSIVDALSYLHSQEPPIAHGDVKPENIRLARPAENCMLVDIEIARDSHSVASAVPVLSSYKAPEQAVQAADARADIYGFGATCYTLLTGSVPVSALERFVQLEQGAEDPLKPAHEVVQTVPVHVSQALSRAMAIDASERFSTVAACWLAVQTSPKALTPAISSSNLPAFMPPPATSRQLQVPLAMKTPLPHLRQRRKSLFKLNRYVISLLLVLFLVVVGSGAGTWLLVHSHQQNAITKRRATTAAAFLSPLSSPSAPAVTPTSSPGSYPDVAGSYTGILVDITSKTSETLILQDIHQIGGMITGYFTMGSSQSLQTISGPFQGTIDISKHFVLIVDDASGHPQLFLEGGLQSATSLSGDFYRCAAPSPVGRICTRAKDGYGIWNAQLLR